MLANSIEAHLNQVKGNLEQGRKSLRSLVGSTLHTYDIPGAVVDQSVSQLGAPQDGDKYVRSPSFHRMKLTTHAL